MLPYDDSDIRLVSKMHVAHYGYRASAEMDVIMDSCIDLGYGADCATRMFTSAKYGEHGPECDSVMGFLDGWVVTDYSTLGNELQFDRKLWLPHASQFRFEDVCLYSTQPSLFHTYFLDDVRSRNGDDET